jgi:hypothetical protein
VSRMILMCFRKLLLCFKGFCECLRWFQGLSKTFKHVSMQILTSLQVKDAFGGL